MKLLPSPTYPRGFQAGPHGAGAQGWGRGAALAALTGPHLGRFALSASLQSRELQVPPADAGERLRRVPLAPAPLPRQLGPGEEGLPAGHQPPALLPVPVPEERDPPVPLQHPAAAAAHAQRRGRRLGARPAERAEAPAPDDPRPGLLLPGAPERRGQQRGGQRPLRGAQRQQGQRTRWGAGSGEVPPLPEVYLGTPERNPFPPPFRKVNCFERDQLPLHAKEGKVGLCVELAASLHFLSQESP